MMEAFITEVKGYQKENDNAKWKAVSNCGYKLEIWFGQTLKKYEEGL